MSVLVDARPPSLGAKFRPGNTFDLTLEWPADELDGRTFTATLDAATLTVSVVADTMTVSATAAQTTAAGVGAHEFTLTETTGGIDQAVIVGRWVGSTQGATSQSTSVEVTESAATVSVSVAAAPAAQTVTHDWDADGWTPFTRQAVNPHGSATVTESVEDSRGRLTGQANTTDGNRRDWWLRDGTLWADSEITSLWWGPSVMDGAIATPQMGHLHRAVEASDGTWTAYVVTNNIFGSAGETINLNVWETDESTLTLGSNGGSSIFSGSLDRALTVTAVRRQNLFIWFADLFVSNTGQLAGVRAGDVMTTDCSDDTFDFTDIAVNAVGSGPGYLRFADPVSTTAVDPTTASGTITPEQHRRYFPYWLKSQLVGTVLRVKVWPISQAEPDWGDTQRVVSFDTAGAGDPSPDIAAAPTGPGYCGLVSAHLRSSAYLEYGETTFRQM